MKRKFFRSVFSRYIISYAIVMVVLFAGVGVYMNYTLTSTVRSDIDEANFNRLGVLRLQHEEKITSLFNLANQISLSPYPYLTPFKLSEEPLKAFYLVLMLKPFTATNDFCDQLYIIFDEDDYLYSSTTSVSLQMYTEKMINYENVSPGMLQALLRRQDDKISFIPIQNTKSSLTNSTNKQIATIIMPLRLDGRFHIGSAMFLIPDDSYKRLFADNVYDTSNTYIFHDGAIFAASRGFDIPDDLILEAVSDAEDKFTQNLTVDGVDYILFMEKGSLFDMSYAALIPQAAMRLSLIRTRFGIGLFLLLLSLPCGLLTVYFTRRHLKPIRELNQSLGSNVSSNDEFVSIRNGIESLIVQNVALNSRLDESLSACRADFVKKFVKGRFLSREEATEAAGRLSLQIDRSFFVVLLLEATLPDGRGPEEFDSLVVTGEDVIGCGMEIIVQEQYLFVLFSDSKQSLEVWANTAKTVLSAVDKDAAIAVSNVYGDFKMAGTAYLEANAAYDNRFVMGSEHVLRFADISTVAKDIEPFTRNFLDGFRKALHAGDAHALNDRINELFQILENKKFSMFTFRVIYNDVISALLNKYFSYDDTSVDALQYYDIFTLSGCRRVSDLAEILRRLCNEILSRDELEDEEPQENSVIKKISAYMRENFTDPNLSMSAIADMHNISAVRLSVDYKELMGMYPSEYLFLLRMEKAKELLATTDMSVKDVGEAVGYYDSSGFIRRFKRHMLITPAQYRQSIKKANS